MTTSVPVPFYSILSPFHSILSPFHPIQYIHEYCDVGDSLLHNPIFSLARWCFAISLNTLEATPHECPLLSSPTEGRGLDGGGKNKPPLRRQPTIESNSSSSSLGAAEDSLDVTVGGKGGGVGRDAVLTPVPEDFEESRESMSSSSGKVGVATSPTRVTFTSDPPLRVGGERNSVSRGSEAPPTAGESSGDTKCAIGRCVVCGGPSNEFSEDVIALCAVVVGTYCSRLPHVVPRYLVSRIIPAFTRSALNIQWNL